MSRVLTALAFALVFMLNAALPRLSPVVQLFPREGPAGSMPKIPSPSVCHVGPKSGQHTRTATALRAIADSIKACPRIIEFDGSKDTEEPEGPLAQARLYYGPPRNVTWAASSDSAKLMHEGYVQFSLPRELWLPPEARSQWANEVAAFFPGMSEDMVPLEYRYKFHVGRNGVRLTGIFVRTADHSEWKEAPVRERACSPFGCAPVCWQNTTESSQILAHLPRALNKPSHQQ